MMTKDIPTTMKAIVAKDYGDIDEMIHLDDRVPVPRLADLSSKQRHRMILQTHAVALAPGDVRVLSGLTRELQGPPEFPYVPGGDCSGVVVEIDDSQNHPFKVGDFVAARFEEGPRGALGEYACVSTKIADKVPEGISAVDAAALVGASPATVLSKRIKEGERVLVMGAGGGMGTTLCQMLRLRGVSYLVALTRSPDKLLAPPLSCDEAIDYTKTDVFSLEKFQREKFDVIVDLAGGGYKRLEDCNEPLIVKTANEGGRFITTVPPVGPIFEIHSILDAMKIFLFTLLWKATVSRLWTRDKLPAYTFGMSLDEKREPVTEIFALAKSNQLKAVVDPAGPFPFTTEGARAAFRVQESRHPHGKVVVKICDRK